MERRSTARANGFTLVELLVVIGIISLLISILLPSLARARQSALSIACQSNLKQIGTLLVMYANDNKRGAMPLGTSRGIDEAGNAHDWRHWATVLEPYASGRTATSTEPIRSGDYSKVFKCPAALMDTSMVVDSAGNPTGNDFHYMAHINLMPDWHKTQTPGADAYWQNARVKPGTLSEFRKRGSEIVLIMDGTQRNDGNACDIAYNVDGCWDFFDDPSSDNEYASFADPYYDRDSLPAAGAEGYRIRWRHGAMNGSPSSRRANFLFCDFHVENLQVGDLKRKNVRCNRNGRKHAWQ